MTAAPPPDREAWPTELRLQRSARTLEIAFDDGRRFVLGAERLRRASPSAAERGHGGPKTDLIDMDASGVGIADLRPVGRYAVRIVFSDGHDSGLYTWPLLYRLGANA